MAATKKRSGFCKSGTHDACSPSGRMIDGENKKFRCSCACHVKQEVKDGK